MRNINDLNYEDFTKLLTNNKQLFDIAFSKAQDTCYWCADEILCGCPRSAMYEFDYCKKYFYIAEVDSELVDYISKINRSYCAFGEKSEIVSKAKKCALLYYKINYPSYYGITDENAERIEKRAEELKKEIERELAEAIYNYSYSLLESDCNIIDEAYESEIFDGFTVDDSGTAYQTITRAFR